MRRGALLTALSLLAACLPAAAETPQIPAQLFDTATPRDMGMGGAVTAVADDLSVVMWNPAAAARIDGKQFIYSDSLRSQPKGLRFASYAQPVDAGDEGLTGCLSYLHVVNNTYGVKETSGVFSFGQELAEGLTGGVSLKYSRYTRLQTAKQAFQVDAGFLYRVNDATSLGLTVLNVTEPRIMDETVLDASVSPAVTKAPLYAPRLVNLGVAYRIHPYVDAGKLGINPLVYRTLLTFDVFDATAEVRRQLRFGVEHELTQRVVGRLGLLRSTPTVGLGYKFAGYRFDAALLFGRRGERPTESALSVRAAF